jgi:hypothetical protein
MLYIKQLWGGVMISIYVIYRCKCFIEFVYIGIRLRANYERLYLGVP